MHTHVRRGDVVEAGGDVSGDLDYTYLGGGNGGEGLPGSSPRRVRLQPLQETLASPVCARACV